MHIDAHQHFWVYDPREYDWIDDSMTPLRRDFLPADLKPVLEQSGFQGCVAVQARQTIEETRWLLELASASPFILGVVGWVDLQSPQVRSQLESFAGNPKLVGVRHVVQGEPDDRFLLRPEFLRGVSTLEEFDLAYDILIYAKTSSGCRRVRAEVSPPAFRAGPLGQTADQECEPAALGGGHPKAGGLAQGVLQIVGHGYGGGLETMEPEHIVPYMDVAFEAFGPQRLMIGSDWPVCTVAASYSRAMGMVKDYLGRLSTEAQQAILEGTRSDFGS